MIKKLFGGKSSEFFLEYDGASNNQSTETKEEATQPAPVAEIAEETTQPVPVAETKEEATQPAPAIAESTTKSNKTSIKSKNKTSTPTTPAASGVTSNGASSWEPPFWVKAMYNNNGSSNGKVEAGEKTFATDYLLPNPSTSRRRPGPSLNKFKEMARQAKIRFK